MYFVSKFWNPYLNILSCLVDKLNISGQSQSTLKTIVILTKVFCTFGLNLVILAWTGEKLSREQAWVWHAHMATLTDESNDNTRKPKLALGKNVL